MLDLLFNPEKAERHPLEILVIGFFYSSLSILLGLWIFDSYASLAVVFLTVLSCMYVIQGAMKMEEKKEKNYQSERWVLKEHKGLVILLISLFLGYMFSFMFWSFFLPEESLEKVFGVQKDAVERIRLITGNASEVLKPLLDIALNNTNIVFISLIFALFYGAGSLYILVWNASVMGYVISEAVLHNGWATLPLVLIKYLLHGVPEMVAYILASLAGGILYFALVRGDLMNKYKVKRILTDVVMLVAIALVLLLASAGIEVLISSKI